MTRERAIYLGAMTLVFGAILAVTVLRIGEQKEEAGRTIVRESAERANQGPYIERAKEISTSETVRVLVVPHPWGQAFDTRCILYANREYHQATIQCPATDMVVRDEFTPLP